MKITHRSALACTVIVLALVAAQPASAQTSPYYILDGDSDIAYIVQNGVLQGTFSTSAVGLGYPVAVRSTVVVGDRDDSGAVEYSLAGVPTGNTFVGGGNFSQLLDGTTDGVQYNYGIECCGAVNSVTRADLFWQGQTALFTVPGGLDGVSIAYDSATASLWIALSDNTVRNFTLAGAEVSQFSLPFTEWPAGLAYEQATNTLWVKENGGGTIYQYSKAGVQLNAITVPGFSPANDYGGEMPMTAIQPQGMGIPSLGIAGLLSLVALLGVAGFLLMRGRIA